MKRTSILVLAIVLAASMSMTRQSTGQADIRSAASRGDWPTVERIASASLAKNSRDRTSALLLTMAQFRQGKNEAALLSAHKTIALDSSLMQAWLIAAECESQLQRSGDAITTLLEARRHFPDSIQPTWALGLAYARNGQCEDAIAPLEETMFRRPDMNGVVQQLAQCYFKTGKVAESVELYARVVEQDPGNSNARLAYGEALMAGRQFDSASVQLREAIRLQPQKAEAYLALTSVLQELKMPEEAMTVSRELTRVSPNDPMGWYNVGLLSLDAQQPDSAIRAFKRAISLKANYAEAYFNIAFAYEERGFDEDAISALKRCATISPLLAPDAYNSLAIMYRKSGRFTEAVSTHVQAIALRDSSVVLHASQLNTYHEAQQCAAAKELLDAELLRFPNSPEILYAAGRCLLRNGEIERVKVIVEKLSVTDTVMAEQLRFLMKR